MNRAHGLQTYDSMQRRCITTRGSPVHGRGVFALQPIAAGERLIEYAGEVTNWRRAAARQRSGNGHTFVFGLSDGRVIDGSRGGNSARFINHAWEPDSEAIESGDELFIDYGRLMSDPHRPLRLPTNRSPLLASFGRPWSRSEVLGL